jgi:hypothetical protein
MPLLEGLVGILRGTTSVREAARIAADTVDAEE